MKKEEEKMKGSTKSILLFYKPEALERLIVLKHKEQVPFPLVIFFLGFWCYRSFVPFVSKEVFR